MKLHVLQRELLVPGPMDMPIAAPLRAWRQRLALQRRLVQLAGLRGNDVLTDEQFEAAKTKVLSQQRQLERRLEEEQRRRNERLQRLERERAQRLEQLTARLDDHEGYWRRQSGGHAAVGDTTVAPSP